MKNIFKIGLLSGIASLALTACLKDTPTTDYSDTSIKPVVIIPNGNFPSTNPAALITLEVSSVPTELKLYARVSWSKPLGKPLEVTFVKKPSLIDDFNTKFGTSFEEMNADAYAVTSYKVTIPADQNEAYIPLKIFTDKVDLGKENMLAFAISDASGEVIGSNYQNIVLPIGVKNKFDGVYSGRIKSTGWAAYGIADGATYSWPSSGISVVTAGANTVTLIMNNFGWDLIPAFTAAGSPTGFGATGALFTFDNATNKLTNVINTYADDGRGRKLEMNPAVTDSRYDPATKKLYLSFLMKQNGRPTQFFYDTLTYFKVR